MHRPSAYAFAGGTGTQADPFMISTPAELASLNSYLGSSHSNKYFKLANDIDLDVSPYNTGSGWMPIGNFSTYFYGHFDGDGHVISNLYMNSASNYRGLFGRIAPSASIKNVGLENVDVSISSVGGALVGYISSDSIVERVYVTGSVNVTSNGGAIFGTNHGTVSQSYSTADVTSVSGAIIGGLGGSNDTGGLIVNCYARGNLTTTSAYTGGLVGNNDGATVTNSYATGAVPDDSSNHGLVSGSISTINNSFWDTETSGITEAITGATGLTTATAKQQSTYEDAGWDFDAIWALNPSINDGYPYLQWQVASDPAPDPNPSPDPDPDPDNDGILNDVENASPNNGDANDDGTLDSSQANVASIVNPVTDKYVTLEVSGDCSITSATMVSEDALAVSDSGFSYDNGLMEFTLSCNSTGQTTTIKKYYHDVDADIQTTVVRKHNPTTGAYFNLTGSYGATVQTQTIAGNEVVVAAYQVTDGGDLDVDGEANGTIVDPAGLAREAVGSPKTGLPQTLNTLTISKLSIYNEQAL